ncbi:MAG: response regulator [Planctomycetaceae bacterium]|nr:response regulator [Planctomycetaceae bacterium]
MLVLSRRPDQKIVFPNIGITIEVLRVRGNIVKLGVDAPPEIKVLRDEVASRLPAENTTTSASSAKSPVTAASPSAAAASSEQEARNREFRHSLANRLNGATLALHLLKKQLSMGSITDVESTFERLLSQLQSVESQLHAPSSGGGMRALVVEDDSNERELLAGFLRMSGFEVVTAQDGCAALDLLRATDRPDVVLLDMRMPRCSGPETLQQIRRDPALEGLKVFAISGSKPEEYDIQTGPQGIDRWFAKPLDPESLVREMARELKVTSSSV